MTTKEINKEAIAPKVVNNLLDNKHQCTGSHPFDNGCGVLVKWNK